MAQAPTGSSTVTVAPLLDKIQRMQNLQREVAKSVKKDQVACIQKIDDLKTIILAEYAALLEEEQKKESARPICGRLQSALVSNGLPRPQQPKDEAQKLFERAHAMERQCQFHRIEQKNSIESYHSFAVAAARIPNAELCMGLVQQLISLGTQIAEARVSLSPLPNAALESPSDPAAARARRIDIYRAENFASYYAVLRLADYCQRLKEYLLNPDASLSSEQRALQIRDLKTAMAADEAHVDGQISCVAEEIRSLMRRYDAFATFYNDCITDMWIIQTAKHLPLKLDDLHIQERTLAQQIAQESPALEAILVESKKHKETYEQIKAATAKLPQYPSLSQYYSYADSLGRPTTVDKAAPEFENIKTDAITREHKNEWAIIKACIDRLCCDILDERIGYLSNLLAKQPDNTELAKMLQKDMEERLNFFIVDIAALGTPTPETVKNLLAKGEELKKGLPYTNQADRFNHVIIQLLAKQAALHTAEYAAQFPATMAELKQLSEPLRTQIAASRTSEKTKPTLSPEELNALESLHRGLDKPATFEGQMKRLVDLKFASLPFMGGDKAWVAEALKCCYFSDAKTQDLLTRKLYQQYTITANEFERQRTTLTSQQEWVALNNQIRNDIAKPLNITEDAIRAKGYDPKATSIQEFETAAKLGRYCTRYTQWWDNGPSQAPKPAAAPASPPNASPESSAAAAVAALSASGAPASPATGEAVVAPAASPSVT